MSERKHESLRIAYQGEPGAYGEEAVIRYFGPQVTPVPKQSFRAVFTTVVEGETDGGLVPIENSQAGSINETYDLLRGANLSLTGELCLPVNHCLLCLPGQELTQIKKVISHPQALAQCDEYLRDLGVEIEAEYDTAGSAKLIREHNLRGVAAVASARAAEIYNLTILARAIQTVKGNYTRFVELSREPRSVPLGPAKTVLMLTTQHAPGSLHKALGVFARRQINLLKLESRPSREQPWEYVFYLDIEGSADSEPVARALKSLREHALTVQIFGSFPRSPDC